ncbi:MAG: hypothetical protein V4664_01835 [Patescibacteria group bacterium]
MDPSEALPETESIDQELIRSRDELIQARKEFDKLTGDLLRNKAYLTKIEEFVASGVPEEPTELEAYNLAKNTLRLSLDFIERTPKKLEELKERIQLLTEKIPEIQKAIRERDAEAKTDKGGKKDKPKKEIKGKDKPKKVDPVGENSALEEAFKQAAEAQDPAATPTPSPTPKKQTPPKSPLITPPPPANIPKTPEFLKKENTKYIGHLTEDIAIFTQEVADLQQKLTRTDLSEADRKLTEKEVAVRQEIITALGEIKGLADSDSPFQYKNQFPSINLDTRLRESKSGWRDRKIIALIKNHIADLLETIDGLRRGLNLKSATNRAFIEKTIAVKELHVEKLWKILNEALKTPPIVTPQAPAAASTSTTPPPTPAGPQTPTPQSGHNVQPSVQSGATNMTTPEKSFAEKALDEAGFAEYAAEVAAKRGMSAEDLRSSLEKEDSPGKELFETYKKLESFKVDLKKLFKEDAKGIIDYEDKDFDSIEKFLIDNRVENPEAIAEIIEQLEQVRKDQKEIVEKEKKIAELTKKREVQIKEFVTKQKQEYETAISEEGAAKFLNEKKDNKYNFFNFYRRLTERYWSEATAKTKLEEEITKLTSDGERIALAAGTTKDVDKELGDLKQQKDDIENRNNWIRSSILQNSAYAKEIQAVAQTKVRERINKMLADKTKGLGAIDSDQDMLTKINHLRNENLSFSYLNDTEATDVQKEIDKEGEETAKRELDKAVGEINLKTSGQYTNFQKTLEKIVNRGKLGSKNGDETKDFIVNTLKDKLNALEKGSTEDKARALHLSLLISKVENAQI